MKPKLLFISPIAPSPDGPGLAMRPYYQIVSLSRIYSIHLLVAGTRDEQPAYGDIRNYSDVLDYVCRFRYSGWKYSLWHRYRHLSDRIRQFINGTAPGFVNDSADWEHLLHNGTIERIAGMKFDRVHVFRLYLTPVAEVLRDGGLESLYSVDIDDIESETRRSIAGLYNMNGHQAGAARLNHEALFYLNYEERCLPWYDRIFTCSGHDRDVLLKRFPGKTISVLPNAVPLRKREAGRQTDPAATILFVGTLDYYPNADALLFFAYQVEPILRAISSARWRLRVVGALPRETWIKGLEKIPWMEFAGWVKDLGAEYDSADIVIAPLRAGGGSRIKILEAFAHGVPVVSTSAGCGGLIVESGVHLLIADDAGKFAEACVRLLSDQVLREKLSEQAFDLASREYCPENLGRAWTDFKIGNKVT
jgi:polysaccharide biosynthesis protein PslH